MPLRPAVKADLIRTAPLFARCSKEEIRRVAAIAEERNLATGTELIREGDDAREFFVVIEGAAEVRRHGRKVSTIGIGGFVGELAILSDTPRSATVTAATPLDVLVISRRDFLSLVGEMPSISTKVARALADRVAADARRDDVL